MKSSSLIGNLAVGADALELLESFGDEELARRNNIWNNISHNDVYYIAPEDIIQYIKKVNQQSSQS